MLRAEIQALRAVAVAIVVIYHLWPGVLRGGFVGVDVFFVISGFLITAYLIRDLQAGGLARVPGFWARRARRLLPASILVLVATALGVYLLVPRGLWQPFFAEIGASALYVENWRLAAGSVDYLAMSNDASPVQHFWSLSVEEQFYFVWPLLVVAALAWSARSRLTNRGWLAVVLGSVTAASLVYSIVLTSSAPGIAYFHTATRAWEFGAGSLLAVFAPSSVMRWERLRAGSSWLGLALILGAAFGFTGAVAFPGAAALLPVVGTLLVIWSGTPSARLAPTRLMSLRPVLAIGGLSYSIYLWHWPLLVLAGYGLGSDLGLAAKAGLIALTIALAAATKALVEDPMRSRSALVERAPQWTLLASACAMVVVIALAGAGWLAVKSTHDASLQRAEQLVAENADCFGADAMVSVCERVVDAASVVPDPAGALSDKPEIYSVECRSEPDDPLVRECVFGDEDAAVRVALIGDSHAASWFPALQILAQSEGWQLHTFFKATCPFSLAARERVSTDPLVEQSCREWNSALQESLAESAAYSLVFTSHHTADGVVLDEAGQVSTAAARDGFRAAWAPLLERGAMVVAISDTPAPGAEGLDCLIQNSADTTRCVISRQSAVRPDAAAEAARDLTGAYSIDMNDYFCDTELCPAVIGGVWVYRDDHHFTETYSQTLAPWLLVELHRAGVVTGQTN